MPVTQKLDRRNVQTNKIDITIDLRQAKNTGFSALGMLLLFGEHFKEQYPNIKTALNIINRYWTLPTFPLTLLFSDLP